MNNRLFVLSLINTMMIVLFGSVPSSIHAQSIQYIGGADVGGFCDALDVSGAYAYLVQSDAGIHIVNISNPASPSALSVFKITTAVNISEYEDIVINGSNAFVTFSAEFNAPFSTSTRLYGLNLASPTNPTTGGFYYISDATRNVESSKLAVVGNDVFLVHRDDSSGYKTVVLDFTNFSTPILRGEYPVPSTRRILSVSASQNLVVATGAATPAPGFRAYEFATNDSPQLLGFSYGHFSTPADVAIEGRWVYLAVESANSENGVLIYDVLKPSAPVLMSAVYFQEKCTAIAVQNSIVYVSTVPGTIKVLDATDPNNISVATQTTIPGDLVASDLVVRDDLVYVAVENGLAILRTMGIQSNKAQTWETYP